MLVVALPIEIGLWILTIASILNSRIDRAGELDHQLCGRWSDTVNGKKYDKVVNHQSLHKIQLR